MSSVSGLGSDSKTSCGPRVSRRSGCLAIDGDRHGLPWKLARSARLATGQIVEDMNLGLGTGLGGTPALFVPEADVTSPLPGTEAAFVSQRTHGNMGT